MAFILPDLPYAPDAFGDTLSAESFSFHHGKHHKAYVDKTNELVGVTVDLAGASLSDVIRAASDRGNRALFNNAAQLWNHSFFWQCLTPEPVQPSGKLADLIDNFGGQDALVAALKQEAVGHFASGWAWLVLHSGALKVTSLHDADSPVVQDGMQPLLTIDVWEHAYYIDYRNARPSYLDALLAKAINWEFVARNLDGNGVARADQAG
jgi:superoxide dismutase, Fe-Mn family